MPPVGRRSILATHDHDEDFADRAGPSQGSPLCPDDRFTPLIAEFRYRLSENHDRALGASVPDHEDNGQLSNGSESAGQARVYLLQTH